MLYGKSDIIKLITHVHIFQVEVKIDNLPVTSKDTVHTNYTIEAALFDSGSWHSSDGNLDLLSSNVADIAFQPSLTFQSSTAPLGFHGFMLVGKLQSPKLWSAEQVRNFINFYVYV